MPEPFRLLSVCGLLGYGFPEDSLRRGMQANPALLGVDAGSTDPGPYYLGSGTSFLKPLQVRRDLELALCAAREARIPLVIGTAGGSGAKPHVEAFLDILLEIAKRRQLHFRMAVIHADIAPKTVLAALLDGRIAPCGPAGNLTAEQVRSCSHLVGQMGTEPIIEALEGGAEVIVAGRCCDTAIFAAMPMLRGSDPALAMHLGKIAECGALCARPAGANDALLGELYPDSFRVEPANPARRCLPDSVAAHSLYEQPAPDCFYEPEGKIDLSACRFEPCGPRGVQVSGTRFVPADTPTIKLEGALLQGYRTVTLAGIRDPLLIANLDEIQRQVAETVAATLAGTIEPEDYTLRFLRYGLDGVTANRCASCDPLPSEMGLVMDAIAPTQELADTVLSLARSTALHQHFEGRKTTAGNLAFPFSPSDIRCGAVYQFAVYHLMVPATDERLFPVSYQEV